MDKIERKLELAYRRAFLRECAAINALPYTTDGRCTATRKQYDRCWELAAITNTAMRALAAYREEQATRAAQGAACPPTGASGSTSQNAS